LWLGLAWWVCSNEKKLKIIEKSVPKRSLKIYHVNESNIILSNHMKHQKKHIYSKYLKNVTILFTSTWSWRHGQGTGFMAYNP